VIARTRPDCSVTYSAVSPVRTAIAVVRASVATRLSLTVGAAVDAETGAALAVDIITVAITAVITCRRPGMDGAGYRLPMPY
jgi:hypothetical protein